MADITIPPLKTCTKCLVTKPATSANFVRMERGKYGFSGRCKSCDKAYYETNRERILAKKREYSQAHRVEAVQRAKRWMRDNIERFRSNQRRAAKKRRDADPDAANAKNREYLRKRRKTEKGKLAEKVYGERRRGRKAQSQTHFTVADVELQMRSQKGKCWHCGKPLGNRITLTT